MSYEGTIIANRCWRSVRWVRFSLGSLGSVCLLFAIIVLILQLWVWLVFNILNLLFLLGCGVNYGRATELLGCVFECSVVCFCCVCFQLGTVVCLWLVFYWHPLCGMLCRVQGWTAINIGSMWPFFTATLHPSPLSDQQQVLNSITWLILWVFQVGVMPP